MTGGLQVGHLGRQARAEEPALLNGLGQGRVVKLAALGANRREGPVLFDHKGLRHGLHLLHHLRFPGRGLQTGAGAIWTNIKPVLADMVHLLRRKGGAFMPRVARLATAFALHAVLGGGRFGRLHNVARRRFGRSGGILARGACH